MIKNGMEISEGCAVNIRHAPRETVFNN